MMLNSAAQGGAGWERIINKESFRAFEVMRKRRNGYPSETRVKRGPRVVHGEKGLMEKLERNAPSPCGSWRRFNKCCMETNLHDGMNRQYF